MYGIVRHGVITEFFSGDVGVTIELDQDETVVKIPNILARGNVMQKIDLGDKVRDTISGFQGVVTAIHVYLWGCRRMTVSPKMNKDKTVPDNLTFDEPQLEVLKKKATDGIYSSDNRVGGPDKFMDEGRSGE